MITRNTDWLLKAQERSSCSHLQAEHTLLSFNERQIDKQPPLSYLLQENDNKFRDKVNPVVLDFNLYSWEMYDRTNLTIIPLPHTLVEHNASCVFLLMTSQPTKCSYWEMLTKTAFLAAQMIRLLSAVQVLHLTSTSSSPSPNKLLTSIVLHSLAVATWNSWKRITLIKTKNHFLYLILKLLLL